MVIGQPGRLVELRKSDIRVPEYQRDANWPRIKKGAKEFDWFLFGVLYVSYRSPDYYVVDGRHRLEMARLIPDIDMVPCMTFNFDGPEHEAEVFVKLQRYRKPLVTKDLHAAELMSGRDFGAAARLVEDFLQGLDSESIPLATLRKLVITKPEAFNHVAPMVNRFVGELPLHKDFIEAVVYLGDELDEGRLFDVGYQRVVALMSEYHQAHHADGRIGKVASPRLKAEALRWALNEGSYHLAPVTHDGAEIGARVVA